MEQVKQEKPLERKKLQTISAFWGNKADKEQTEEFANIAALSGKHREILFEYIEKNTDHNMLYKEHGEVDSKENKSEPIVTSMKQAKRRNDNLSMPELDIYEYFTDRGSMCGSTSMQNNGARLAGMAFLAESLAKKPSPYELQSNKLKTQMLIVSADSAEHLVKEKQKKQENFSVKEKNQILKNCEKLAENGTEAHGSEFSKLAKGIALERQNEKIPKDKKIAENIKSKESKEVTEESDGTKRLAQEYLGKEKKKENFLNLGNMVYDRDRSKLDRLALEDYALETGKAAALLVLENFHTEGKTLADILRINEAKTEKAEETDDLPLNDDNKNNEGGGENSEE